MKLVCFFCAEESGPFMRFPISVRGLLILALHKHGVLCARLKDPRNLCSVLDSKLYRSLDIRAEKLGDPFLISYFTNNFVIYLTE